MNKVGAPTPAWEELADLDALDQAALVRNGVVSPQELVACAIERIEAADARCNLLATALFDQALEASELPPDGPSLPFHGVPFLVKDLIARVAQSPQTEGSLMLADQIADRDSELVRRYRKAGLLILGRTTTSEFGHVPLTEGRLFGVTRNPWALERTPGGSSGGAGVAVATRAVPIAHGSDAGGSLRIPASCCGVFALKPQRGRQPMELEFGVFNSHFVSEHVISRSVRDSAALLDATAEQRRPVTETFLATTRGDGTNRPLRIAMQTEAIVDVPVAAECRRAVEIAASRLEQLGHLVEPATPPLAGNAVFTSWFGLWADAMGWQVAQAARKAGRQPTEAYFDAGTWNLYQTARDRTPLDTFDDVLVLKRAARSIDEFMARYDLWLTPTLAQPPLEHGSFAPSDEDVSPYLLFSPFARLANISGHPACSLPTCWSDEGLPIGVQLLGRSEKDLFAVASALEQAFPWAARVPPA